MKIYNKIYKVSPWKDNELFYTIIQGEGGIKYPRLQIIDENGAIDLSNSTLTYTITLPDNSEEIVNGEILDAKFGIIEFGIVASMSNICGIAKGNLNILNGGNILKVGGINLVIEPATDGHEIEASEKFSMLLEAIKKVEQQPYNLTEEDKDEIANLVMQKMKSIDFKKSFTESEE